MFYQEALPKFWTFNHVNSLLRTGDRYWQKLAAMFEKPNQPIHFCFCGNGMWGAYFCTGACKHDCGGCNQMIIGCLFLWVPANYFAVMDIWIFCKVGVYCKLTIICRFQANTLPLLFSKCSIVYMDNFHSFQKNSGECLLGVPLVRYHKLVCTIPQPCRPPPNFYIVICSPSCHHWWYKLLQCLSVHGQWCCCSSGKPWKSSFMYC